MALVLTATANPGVASWSDATAVGNYVVHKVRVQLADLPAAATTGNVSFGDSIPANTVLVGASIYMNSAVDLGASGIVSVSITVGVSLGNLITSTDAVGVAANRYINAFTDGPSFVTPPFVTLNASQPVYVIVSDGPNLNGLAAFDATIFVIASPTVLTVP